MGKLGGSLAAGLGHALRLLIQVVIGLIKNGPVVVGFALVVYGLSLIDSRVGWIAAGVILVILFSPRPKEKK